MTLTTFWVIPRGFSWFNSFHSLNLSVDPERVVPQKGCGIFVLLVVRTATDCPTIVAVSAPLPVSVIVSSNDE